jgi:hypothetical protein
MTNATSILEEIQCIREMTGVSKKLCLQHDLANASRMESRTSIELMDESDLAIWRQPSWI